MRGRTLLAIVLTGLGLLAAAVIAKTRCGRAASFEGGVRGVYSLDLDLAVADRTTELARDLRLRIDEAKLDAKVSTPPAPVGALTVTISSPRDKEEIERMFRDFRDTFEPRACSEPDALCFKIVASYAETIKQAGLDTALGTIRARFESADYDVAVVKQGDKIIIELPLLDGDRAAAARKLIARSGKLELKVVDDGSEPGAPGRGALFMQRLFAHVGDPTDPLAKQLGVFAETDYWRPEEGSGPHSDYYLKAFDQNGVPGWQTIERYLAELAKSDASYKVPDDRQIAYEHVEPSMSEDRRSFWRSYYLVRATQLSGREIANVAGAESPYDGRPIVLLDFTKLGTRIFADLTGRIAGQKLATILDGTISSAPIINGAIRGGRASITMGAGDIDHQRKERDELIRVLKAGALPAPLREESWTTIGSP